MKGTFFVRTLRSYSFSTLADALLFIPKLYGFFYRPNVCKIFGGEKCKNIFYHSYTLLLVICQPHFLFRHASAEFHLLFRFVSTEGGHSAALPPNLIFAPFCVHRRRPFRHASTEFQILFRFVSTAAPKKLTLKKSNSLLLVVACLPHLPRFR